MPHINEMKDSNFLKKEDCGSGILVTIKECFQENVAKQGAPPEMKWCLSFNEVEKPIVLNSTNAQIIAVITGSENTDDWSGHKVVLYNDPNVSYAGKLTGGIRARAPRNQAPPTHGITGKPNTRQSPAPQEDALPEDDSVPF